MSGRSDYYSRQRIAEELEEEFSRALSFTAEQERRKRRTVSKENEDLQLALALSKAVHDESLEEDELKQAQILNMRIQQQKEKSEIELALALSISELDREDQLVGSSRESREEVPRRRVDDGLLHGHFPWNWENDQVDMIQFSDDESDNEDALPEVYKDYRRVPTMFSESHMWSRSAVDRQWRELRSTFGGESDAVREWTEGQCESERCLVCLSNVATRMALPCAHRLCCRPCESELVDKHLYYSVTSPNGEISTTEWRLPIQCFVCRAIMGQIVSLH